MFWCQSQVIPFPPTDSKQEKKDQSGHCKSKDSVQTSVVLGQGLGGVHVCVGCSHNRNHMFSSREQQHGLYERWEFVACRSEIVFRPGSKCPSFTSVMHEAAESFSGCWTNPNTSLSARKRFYRSRADCLGPYLRLSVCILLFCRLEGPKTRAVKTPMWAGTSWSSV